MEPLAATATLISVAGAALRTAAALIEYTKNTKNAASDRLVLAEEALALSRILKRLQTRNHERPPDDQWLEDRKEVIRQFVRAYEDLATVLHLDMHTAQLKTGSRLKNVRTLAKWSFTKSEVYSILERVTRLQQYATTLLLEDQHSAINRIESRQEDALDKEQKQAILVWLSPLQMSRIHQTISCRAGEGSGRWFVKSKEFCDWEGGMHHRLWASGIPGAGKTVIASIVVQRLRKQHLEAKRANTVGIAVIYLKYNDPSQTLENLIGSVTNQLLSEQTRLPQSLLSQYEEHRTHNTLPSIEELSEILSASIGAYDEVYVVIDALDECSEEVRWRFISKIREHEAKVRLLITSRFLDSIDEELDDFERSQIKADRADLELFIDNRIEENKHLLRSVRKSPSLRADIKEAVVKTAEDMFLLASLHVESIAGAAALSIRHVRNKLKSLPTTLKGTYDEAMRRIEAQDSEHQAIALKTLAWVSYAFRPLSLRELQHALAIEPGQSELDHELLMDEHNITALCAGLVIVDLGNSVVNLVHYTAKNYFEDVRIMRFPGFHGTITMSCATYLALNELRNASIWDIAQRYPLACYAAQYMGEHAR